MKLKTFGLGAVAFAVALALGAAAFATLPKPPNRPVVTATLVIVDQAPEQVALVAEPAVVTPAAAPPPSWTLESAAFVDEIPAEKPLVQLAVAEVAQPCGTVVAGLNWMFGECQEDAWATLQNDGGPVYDFSDFYGKPAVILAGFQQHEDEHDKPRDKPRDKPHDDGDKPHKPPHDDGPKHPDKPHKPPHDDGGCKHGKDCNPPPCYGDHCNPPPPPPPSGCEGDECNTGSDNPDGPLCLSCTQAFQTAMHEWQKRNGGTRDEFIADVKQYYESQGVHTGFWLNSVPCHYIKEILQELLPAWNGDFCDVPDAVPYTPIPGVVISPRG